MSIVFFAAGVPFAIAGLNRAWRGGGIKDIPKPAWFAFNVLIAWCLTFNWVFCLAWLLLLLGYAVPPTHAMFSAVHGLPPARDDSAVWQWMREVSLRVNKALPSLAIGLLWARYGVIYGFVRALLMMPGAVLMAGLAQSPALLACSFVFLLLGMSYFIAGTVKGAEIATGFVLGVYLVACAAFV
jgi:hypothetical protein